MALRADSLLSDTGLNAHLARGLPGRTGDIIARVVPDVQTFVITTQVDATTSVAPANLSQFTANLLPLSRYRIQGRLLLLSDATGGSRFDFDGGAATAASVAAQVKLFTAAAVSVSNATALATDHTAAAAHIAAEWDVYILTSGTGGTFIPRFAQSASNLTSSVLVGSVMWVTRFAQ